MYKREEEDGEGLGVVIQMNSHLTQTKQHLCKEKGDELVCGSCSFSNNASFNRDNAVGRKEKERRNEMGERTRGFERAGAKINSGF